MAIEKVNAIEDNHFADIVELFDSQFDILHPWMKQ
jgi:hypothetical protein